MHHVANVNVVSSNLIGIRFSGLLHWHRVSYRVSCLSRSPDCQDEESLNRQCLQWSNLIHAEGLEPPTLGSEGGGAILCKLGNWLAIQGLWNMSRCRNVSKRGKKRPLRVSWCRVFWAGWALPQLVSRPIRSLGLCGRW